MEVDAIGREVAPSTVTNNDTINQQEFVRLFLAQLQAQDPLEPQDNSEFMAQLAQFSNIEQNRQNGEKLESLNFINSVNQGTNMLNKTVEISTTSGNVVGRVTTVFFTQSGPRINVVSGSGEILNDIRLSQIRSVRN